MVTIGGFHVGVYIGLMLLCGSWAKEVCYEPCGCFSNSKPFRDRGLPKSPDSQGLRWHLLTRNSPDNRVMISANQIPSSFNPDKPTKILVHGWRANAGAVKSISDAFLKAARYDYNIILVDWEKGASGIFYPQQASNARVVGACTGHLLQQIAEKTSARYSEMHCIGTSLGAHVCGYVGKYLNGELGRISGLDPAGPYFGSDNALVRLDKTDALFTDVIHTNTKGLISFGIGKAVGHVDFFPNKAKKQPPCENSSGPNCDHLISQSYYIQSIRARNQCNFNAYPCPNMKDADKGLCETCSGADCQKMGYYSNTMPGRGSFFLRTVKQSPYCEN